MLLNCTAMLQHSGRSVMLEGDLMRCYKLPQPRFIATGRKEAQLLM